MSIFEYIIIFFLGACFISCGNCIRYRTLHGLDWVRGHSICEGCGRQLRVWELVPVLSCVILRGRCPRCNHFFGYSHAESEFLGGFLCLMLAMPHNNILDAMTPVVSFSTVYCVASWIQGTQGHFKLK